MKQNVLELACDRFGCHVVQKAVEFVAEDQKVIIASEMFQRTRDTITHRFASHVWQRIFEIKWKTPLPILLEKVNAALSGHWATIANDEHGSLVVQCIFENSASDEKHPIINEVLIHVQNVAKGMSPYEVSISSLTWL
jgi:hypothetical protein